MATSMARRGGLCLLAVSLLAQTKVGVTASGGGPYGGVPATIPGVIQVAEFDLGGEGVGYSDSTAGNIQGAFRPDEDVDINYRTTPGAGYNVAFFTAGEYLRYTVDVTQDVDAFVFSFLVASGNGLGKFRIVSGGTGCDNYTNDLSGLISVPNTGGSSDDLYQDVYLSQKTTGGLRAGINTIWLCVESKGFAIQTFTMAAPPGLGKAGIPYGGVPATIPGVIQVEEFDVGGERVGYVDSTPGNIQEAFRAHEDVDIHDRQSPGVGYNVAYFTAGEWLRFTVDVTEDVDAFRFSFLVASGNALGKFRIVTGGSCSSYTTDLSGLVKVPNTGGSEENQYLDFEVSGKGNGGLKAGLAFIYLCVESHGFSIDSFTMSTASETGKAGMPYNGAPAAIPGVIEAEEYDLGGKGVAYSDTTPKNIYGAFRPHDGVDINAIDVGYGVSYIAAGEYLRYTVDVTKDVDAFLYNFKLSSSNGSGKFRLVSGGTGCDNYTTDLTGIVTAPKSAGSSDADYQDFELSGRLNCGLPAGPATIWLCAISNGFSIDSFTMTEDTSPPPAPIPAPKPTPAPIPDLKPTPVPAPIPDLKPTPVPAPIPDLKPTPVPAPIPAPKPVGGAYGGVSAIIPGIIQAEEFDIGGEGVGYSDSTTGNVKNVFRPNEDVDIAALDVGYYVGWVTAGEYLRYTVDVTKDVEAFVFKFRIATDNVLGTFRVVSGGTGCDDYTTELSGLVTAPSTGGYNRYETYEVSGNGNGGLPAGPATIWLCAESRAFALDYFTMTEVVTPAPEPEPFPTPAPPAPTPTPAPPSVNKGGAFGGIPATVPGLIEAEGFDTGGQGVGYYDSTDGNKKGEYRPNEDVDINELDNGGFNVGYIAAGEYLRYTVDVTKKIDDVFFNFRVASADGLGSFRIVTGGTGCDNYTTDLSGLVSVPSTGGNVRYENLAVNGNGTGGLRAKETIIWLCVESKSFNIDYFTMSKTATLTTVPVEEGDPYGGVPATVPGTIQAEEFDTGGEGVAYSDSSDGNNKGAFRPNEDVDINDMGGGEYNVGYITAGEYLRYTVDVTKKIDDVFFNFRVASADGLGTFRIVSGGTGCDDYTTDLSGLVSVPATGGNIRYQDLEVSGNGTGGLRARETKIWLCVVSKSFNIDYFTVSKKAPLSPAPTPSPTSTLDEGGPFDGIPATVPGTIQAEEFDTGGEGVAYTDSTTGNKKGEFRPNEDVDINTMNDGGFNVGYVTAGEYLRYTVDVTKKIDDVFFTFRVSSAHGLGTFRVVSGGTGCDDYTTDLSGLVSVSTGGNNRYQDVAVSGNGTGGLRAGETKIWLCVVTKSFNIDFFTMAKTSTVSPSPTPSPTPSPASTLEQGDPFEGVAATVPGIVQAEEFDTGGEGVGYSDSTDGNKKGALRPTEDVDVNAMADGGYNVGYVAPGEYLRYTLDVTNKMTDIFFNFRVASANGLGSFRIVTGGTGCDDYTTDLSGLVSVPATGGNSRYENLAVSGNGTGGLRARETKIWLCIESKSFNLDYFTMLKTAA